MSTPYDPNQQYPNQQYPNQQYPNQQYPNQQYPPGQGYNTAQPYRSYEPQFAPPPPKKPSNKPLIIAGVFVALLAVAATLILVLRDGKDPAKPEVTATPAEVAQEFFEAVDARDETAMRKIARGSLEDDVEDIMGTPKDDKYVFANGEASEAESKKVDGKTVAAMYWKVTMEGLGDGNLRLVLLDEGSGYEICEVDESGGDVTEALDYALENYKEVCN